MLRFAIARYYLTAIAKLFRFRKLQKLSKFIVVAALLSTVCFYVFSASYQSTNDSVHFENDATTASPFISAMGTLNIHVWRGVCDSSLGSLRKHLLFPQYPDEMFLKINTIEFHIEDNSVDYGQRIFGFLHPPESNEFQFAISSDDESELWFSLSDNPTEKQLIARVYKEGENAWTEKNQLNKYSEQISKHFTLAGDKKYYIEVVHKQGIVTGFVQVYWRRVKAENDFELISSKYLSSHAGNAMLTRTKDVLHNLLSERYHEDLELKLNLTDHKYLQFYSLPLIPKEGYLPSCDFKTSSASSDRVYRYQGRKMIRVSSVYPSDDSSMKSRERIRKSWPNQVADQDIILAAVEKIMKSLSLKMSNKYFLKRVHKVLYNSNPAGRDHYSMDLELGLQGTNQSYRLSEHIFGKNADWHSLCFPARGMNWDDKAKVYFILPVKDQGRWVYHFINQLTVASLLTGDTNFHVIVADFESQDIDMTKAFNTTLFRNRHTIVSLKGNFYKTLALNKAVEHIPSIHDLLFLFDLHIDVPVDIMDSVRRNTIEGHLVYAPIVGRLRCGSTFVDHKGFWEMEGFGLLSVYKSDWIRFRGMNTKDYKYKWGGEDWDLLDRILNAELEVVRIKHPGLYHHYQTKNKAWN